MLVLKRRVRFVTKNIQNNTKYIYLRNSVFKFPCASKKKDTFGSNSRSGCSNNFVCKMLKWNFWSSTKNFFIDKIPYTLSNIEKIWQITWMNINSKAPKLRWNNKSIMTDESCSRNVSKHRFFTRGNVLSKFF